MIVPRLKAMRRRNIYQLLGPRVPRAQVSGQVFKKGRAQSQQSARISGGGLTDRFGVVARTGKTRRACPVSVQQDLVLPAIIRPAHRQAQPGRQPGGATAVSLFAVTPPVERPFGR